MTTKLSTQQRDTLTRRRKGKRHLSPSLYFFGLLTVATLVIAGGFLARQVSSVREDLTEGITLAADLRTQVSQGKKQEARDSYVKLEEHVSTARGTVTAPLWKAASVVPIIGANFGAISEATVSADDVVTRALGPLLSASESLDLNALSPVDGRIDIDLLTDAAPAITSAASTVELSKERLTAIDLDALLPNVAEPIEDLTRELGAVSAPLRTAASAVQLIPNMLGADGPRHYLLLIQNSAEARTTGGIPGALAVVKASDGRIDLEAQGSASNMGSFAPPIDVDPEQVALFTPRLGRHMQNVNLTPDFPTAANTAKQMWEIRYPEQLLDGVLALDPSVLAHVLEATGPVAITSPQTLELIKGTELPTVLNSRNVTSTLLSDVYREIDDPAIQDLYFADMASTIFSAFTTGGADGGALLGALVASAEEERLYLWSSHQSEQRIIESTRLAGNINGMGTSGAAFGVYFNDGTGAKMDYYARRTVELIQTCPDNDYSRYSVRLVLANLAPDDAATSLPAYVTGNGAFGVEPGTIRTNYVFYGPVQSVVEGASLNGKPVAIGSGLHENRPVGTVTVTLAPGETAEVDLRFSKVIQDSEPLLRVTPTLLPKDQVVLPFVRDPACESTF